MQSIFSVLACLLVAVVANCQTSPLTQRQACERFSSSIVSINAGGNHLGTGFLVSSGGFILTANHVIRDDNGSPYLTIEITLADKTTAFAKVVSQMTPESIGQDFALLKIEHAVGKLPFLTLGSVGETNIGEDATVIGYPFSAISHGGGNVRNKFCLSVNLAAISVESVPVSGTTSSAKGVVPFNRDVKVDVIYFQGPSVKGISGSPVISRDTGNVVGIVSTKLTGISAALDEDRKRIIGSRRYFRETTGGVDTFAVLTGLIDTLDNQLANGMGSATGIDDPEEVLRRIEKKKK
jgi:S1-C subfamily serine protease